MRNIHHSRFKRKIISLSSSHQHKMCLILPSLMAAKLWIGISDVSALFVSISFQIFSSSNLKIKSRLKRDLTKFMILNRMLVIIKKIIVYYFRNILLLLIWCNDYIFYFTLVGKKVFSKNPVAATGRYFVKMMFFFGYCLTCSGLKGYSHSKLFLFPDKSSFILQGIQMLLCKK